MEKERQNFAEYSTVEIAEDSVQAMAHNLSVKTYKKAQKSFQRATGDACYIVAGVVSISAKASKGKRLPS